ncbi:hypothetical protein T02_16517 [Trichinella nativa]|uniref:Uncharacterized protein n=1 Tax=Trichinella nativa TaxID=6335 RepID=A0A0V1LB89_9BILA|nr:hypothetical protein T02_16517 [Trichinella nativa]
MFVIPTGRPIVANRPADSSISRHFTTMKTTTIIAFSNKQNNPLSNTETSPSKTLSPVDNRSSKQMKERKKKKTKFTINNAVQQSHSAQQRFHFYISSSSYCTYLVTVRITIKRSIHAFGVVIFFQAALNENDCKRKQNEKNRSFGQQAERNCVQAE